MSVCSNPCPASIAEEANCEDIVRVKDVFMGSMISSRSGISSSVGLKD